MHNDPTWQAYVAELDTGREVLVWRHASGLTVVENYAPGRSLLFNANEVAGLQVLSGADQGRSATSAHGAPEGAGSAPAGAAHADDDAQPVQTAPHVFLVHNTIFESRPPEDVYAESLAEMEG